MDTTAIRSSEPLAMIPFIFLKDNYLKNPFFEGFHTSLWRINIRPAPDPAPAFSGTMKISRPPKVSFLQKQDDGDDSILFPHQAGIYPSRSTQVLCS
jgi:hypothetical protein